MSVATPQQFNAAVAAGEKHIVVTEHLDLRDLPRLGDGLDSTLEFLASPSELLTLRGNCTSPLPTFATGPTPTERLPDNACAITVASRFMYATEDTADVMWLDNLFIRLESDTPVDALLHFWPSDGDTHVYLTGVTLAGDHKAAGINAQNVRLYAQDCVFDGSQTYGIYTDFGARASVVSSRFTNTSASAGIAGAATARGSGRLLLENTGISGTTNGSDIAVVDAEARCYTDLRGDSLNVDPAGIGQILPLSEAQGMPTAADERFVRVQRDLGLTTFVGGVQPADITTSGAEDTTVPTTSGDSGDGGGGGGSGSSAGIIAGVAAAVVVALLVAAAAAFVLVRRRRRAAAAAASKDASKDVSGAIVPSDLNLNDSEVERAPRRRYDERRPGPDYGGGSPAPPEAGAEGGGYGYGYPGSGAADPLAMGYMSSRKSNGFARPRGADASDPGFGFQAAAQPGGQGGYESGAPPSAPGTAVVGDSGLAVPALPQAASGRGVGDSIHSGYPLDGGLDAGRGGASIHSGYPLDGGLYDDDDRGGYGGAQFDSFARESADYPGGPGTHTPEDTYAPPPTVMHTEPVAAAPLTQPPSVTESSRGTASTGGAAAASTGGAVLDTRDAPDLRTALLTALDTMAAARPEELFDRRYSLMGEREAGAQTVVAFARPKRGGMMQYAIKFFLDPEEFEREVAFYVDQVLSQTLPPLIHANDNANRGVRTRRGFVFPPYLVLERGVTLTKWAADVPRGFGEVLTMLESVAQLLEVLHTEGLVHRDVKPANTLYLLTSAKWKLLDVGIVARDGEDCFPQCTLSYAPPEVISAVNSSSNVIVSTTHDMWALGVMAYEAITRSPAFASKSAVYAAAAGEAPYPWAPENRANAPEAWRQSQLRPLVERCLARDPVKRATARDVLAGVARLCSVSSV